MTTACTPDGEKPSSCWISGKATVAIDASNMIMKWADRMIIHPRPPRPPSPGNRDRARTELPFRPPFGHPMLPLQPFAELAVIGRRTRGRAREARETTNTHSN
ncbi:hypothetical protein GCM10010149_45010 [Nonomuraea roseoviolacea subsp. roseoviolacea]